MPADDVLDGAAVETVKQRQEALAGNGKHPATSVCDQLISEDLSSVSSGHTASPASRVWLPLLCDYPVFRFAASPISRSRCALVQVESASGFSRSLR